MISCGVSVHQVYNRFHAAVDFKSLNQRKGSLNRTFGTAFSLITDQFRTSELCLDVHLDVIFPAGYEKVFPENVARAARKCQ